MRKDTTRHCYPTRPCNNFRVCERCARQRQRQLADSAETMERIHGALSLTRLTPDDAGGHAVRVIREAYQQRCKANAGIWTIEAGELGGKLHANIITPVHRPIILTGASSWTQPIIGNVRNVAAYIGKRSQIPALRDYDGHTRGRWGSLSAWLLDPASDLVPRAASIESQLLASYNANHGTMHQYPPKPTPAELTAWATRSAPEPEESYATIAARHLPRLLALRHGSWPNKRTE